MSEAKRTGAPVGDKELQNLHMKICAWTMPDDCGSLLASADVDERASLFFKNSLLSIAGLGDALQDRKTAVIQAPLMTLKASVELVVSPGMKELPLDDKPFLEKIAMAESLFAPEKLFLQMEALARDFSDDLLVMQLGLLLLLQRMLKPLALLRLKVTSAPGDDEGMLDEELTVAATSARVQMGLLETFIKRSGDVIKGHPAGDSPRLAGRLAAARHGGSSSSSSSST